MKYQNLLIDGLNIYKMCYATSQDLTTAGGRPTGAVYTTLAKIRSLCKLIQTEDVTVLWDTNPSWRHLEYPKYKGTRIKEDQPGMREQLEQLKFYLSSFGIHQHSAPEMEADDLAGAWFRHADEENPVIFFSADKDWLQLVGDHTHLYRPAKKDVVMLDNFQSITGCRDPQQFLAVKGIVGDAGDNVPGQAGIGERTAIKYLQEDINPNTVKYQRIVEWMDDPHGFANSFYLMNLREGNLSVPDLDTVPADYDPEMVKYLCTENEYGSILKNVEQWCSVFPRAGQ